MLPIQKGVVEDSNDVKVKMLKKKFMKLNKVWLVGWLAETNSNRGVNSL